MNKRTAALLAFAALVADVSAFRPQQSVAFVVRGGAEDINDNVNVLKESSPNAGGGSPNNETVKTADELEEFVCMGDVCEMRGGSGTVNESSDPVDEEAYDDYEELDEDEELIVGNAEFADEEEEEEDEEDYAMMEVEGVEEGEDSTSEVDADGVDAESVEESEEQTELPETEVASKEEEAVVEEEIEEEDQDIEDEERDIEVELAEEYLAEDEEEDQGDAEEVEVTISEEAQGTWEENTDAPPSPYEGDTVVHHATDDDSSAFVDREELADAYEDDETMVGSTTTFRAGHAEEDDRASIDDVPAAEEAAANIQELEQTEQPEATQLEEEETVEEMNEAAEKAAAVRPVAVTKEIENILVQECGFQKSEIRGLKPQIAYVMADKKLRRPIEGIPASWYESKNKGVLLASLGKVLTAFIPMALGALAVYGGLDVRNILGDAKTLIGVKEPEKIQKDKSEPTTQSFSTTSVEEEVEEEPVEETPKPIRRLKQGVSQGNDEGKLWLDKQIDAVGDRLNSLLRK